MKMMKKAMAFDDMPEKQGATPVDSVSDNSPGNTTGDPMDEAAEPSEAPEMASGETDGDETATLSSDMLSGQDLKPGSEIKLRVVSVSPEDGTVTVSAASGDKGIAKASKTYDLKGEM